MQVFRYIYINLHNGKCLFFSTTNLKVNTSHTFWLISFVPSHSRISCHIIWYESIKLKINFYVDNYIKKKSIKTWMKWMNEWNFANKLPTVFELESYSTFWLNIRKDNEKHTHFTATVFSKCKYNFNLNLLCKLF